MNVDLIFCQPLNLLNLTLAQRPKFVHVYVCACVLTWSERKRERNTNKCLYVCISQFIHVNIGARIHIYKITDSQNGEYRNIQTQYYHKYIFRHQQMSCQMFLIQNFTAFSKVYFIKYLTESNKLSPETAIYRLFNLQIQGII